MSTQKHDPIFESLDRLAGVADHDMVGDRMPDIQRRVRVSRQRKGVSLVAAAVVVAVGSVGVWHGMPSDSSAPPVVTQPSTPFQRITIDAQAQGADHLRISFTVTGRSTVYVDRTTGKPIDYAGPRNTTVLVDRKEVSGSDGGAISCEVGGSLKRYTKEFNKGEPLVVAVSPGQHTVVVRAPYCDDGDLVESTESVVVVTEAGGFTTFDRQKADLDGDGTDEVVRILVPEVQAEDQQLAVSWGTGETTTASFPNTMETGLRDPVDLDGDGHLELILLGGGGEASVYWVYLADATTLEQVRTVDAEGSALSLHSDTDPAAWQTYLGSDGISSYRLTDPTATKPPFPVEVRSWTLVGNTLEQSAESVARCMVFQPVTDFVAC